MKCVGMRRSRSVDLCYGGDGSSAPLSDWFVTTAAICGTFWFDVHFVQDYRYFTVKSRQLSSAFLDLCPEMHHALPVWFLRCSLCIVKGLIHILRFCNLFFIANYLSWSLVFFHYLYVGRYKFHILEAT